MLKNITEESHIRRNPLIVSEIITYERMNKKKYYLWQK